jgi:hypothetical protein
MPDATLTTADPDQPADDASGMQAKRIEQHLISVIERTPVLDAPFEHMVLENLWPAHDYPALLRALPADAYYRPLKHSDALLPDGRSARLQFPLLPENIARLPDAQRAFWLDIAGAVGSPRVLAAWQRRFAPALARVTGRPASGIRLRPYATLFRDIGGYRISMHPDSPRKAITTQYYLPADDSQLHLGTLFHTRRDDGGYDTAKRMRFAPNSGYAFAVSPTSYHSVDPMRDADKPRNSLMVIISHDRGPLVEGVKSAQKRLRAWYDRARGQAPADAGEGTYETL